ncbi:MAG: ERCC4 domain-containing protein [Nanoarchaeota archaeon]
MPFHDIFSKKETPNQKNHSAKIIIDIHEKNSLIPSELSLLNVPYEFQSLKIGDYLINDIVIERKSFQDLQSSIISKRIFTQLEEIKQSPSQLLIIENNQDENSHKNILHKNALRGFFLSTSLIHKIPILFTENEKDTALYLSILAKKQQNENISLRPSKIAFSKEEQQQFILEGFPNIGPVTAKKLLAHFKTLKNIFLASKEELEEILGKKAENFKKLLEYSC